ncbi:hypothetical protein [Thermodesulfobacterium hydrogeniphilum]|uniref:hypothetical protein n=1 Tax=Thermodesulfobacterium hydrogeniphilum TaxID=161156 RepID=UPI000571E0F8|nr:hypothetical protein [Thermodesulfobacterium hydrogeniphilum]
MNKENKVYVDPLNITFAKFMEITTYIGLIVMVIFGLLYLFGLPGFVNMKHAISHWNLPVSKFWEEVKGIRVYGYSWFLTNLTAMDCLSMVGICILALAPLAGLVSGIFKTKGQKAYTIFFIILTIEFLFAILKPIIMPGVGGH